MELPAVDPLVAVSLNNSQDLDRKEGLLSFVLKSLKPQEISPASVMGAIAGRKPVDNLPFRSCEQV